MWIIAGLGNPGKEYQKTRHNAGFLVLDQLASQLDIKLNEHKFESILGRGERARHKVLLLKPQTYMNKSGEAIVPAMNYYKVTAEHLLVVVDDFNLELGVLRFRAKGSAGGHHGLESIVQQLGTADFKRLRIGIGTADSKDADFVLGAFTKEEMAVVKETVVRAAEAIEFLLGHSFENTMNRYNLREK
ncbi:MAG: aminoacyl-tRNA hydrolase [bacterium]|nr:aminoacyl-tRNA hydrolase [bacterium]MDD5353890.1 aminoacyl-tRNA hydrolase [bacterium]MDD5756994.1 aminoacyl-tRNA hydrolase [bacterium]